MAISDKQVFKAVVKRLKDVNIENSVEELTNAITELHGIHFLLLSCDRRHMAQWVSEQIQDIQGMKDKKQ